MSGTPDANTSLDASASRDASTRFDASASLGASTSLDASVEAGPLAEAAARLARLLPVRTTHPAHAGVLLRADGDGLLLLAADGEVSARLRVPAVVHEWGEVLVSRRGLAETAAALDAPEVRLVAEGSRLAVRTPGARFALPSLGTREGQRAYPVAAALPRRAGQVAGPALRAAVAPVAGAASREHALPIFTGVRLRSAGGRLSLLATDRYRLASASLPWVTGPASSNGATGAAPAGATTALRPGSPDQPAVPEVDALVPAAILAEAARQAGRADTVAVHAEADLFGLSWKTGSVVVPTLGDAFPDTQLGRLLDLTPECEVEVEADALAGAVDRASRYAGAPGRVAVEATDGVLLVRASDPLTGESEEAVKAAVRGDRLTRSYQARILLDALRAFGQHRVELRIQGGTRATELCHASPEAPVDLRYLVVPLRAGPASEDSGAMR